MLTRHLIENTQKINFYNVRCQIIETAKRIFNEAY